jgi:hypothetical protein
MRKIIIWGGGSLLVALVLYFLHLAVAVGPASPRETAADADALQVGPVDLGSLQPGETRAFQVHLRNTSLRPLHLLPPESDCGCIYHDANKSLTLPPDGSIALSFSLRAPAWPGEISKKIELAARHSAGPRWQVPVTARVVAKAWAVPPALELDYDQEPVLEPSVTVHHQEETRIGAVVSSSPAITVDIEHRGASLVQVDLTIRPPPLKSGETWEQALQVFEENSASELLRIPVRVSCPPELRCLPEQVVLNSQEGPGARLERTVVVLPRSDTMAGLEADPLLPWVHVESQERRGQGYSVRLRFDQAAMPDNVDENIVRFALKGTGSPAYLRGTRKQ